MGSYFVYILTSRRNGTLYIGVTNNLSRRLDQHRIGSSKSFTNKYHVTKLVYYESFNHPDEAIRREKNLKDWKRVWKLQQIEAFNPSWKDLSKELLD